MLNFFEKLEPFFETVIIQDKLIDAPCNEEIDFSEKIKKYSRFSEHSLNLNSYLTLVIPSYFLNIVLSKQKQIYLILGNENQAYSYFHKKFNKIYKIVNVNVRKCFEGFILAFNSETDYEIGIYNICTEQRLFHYELMLWFYNDKKSYISNIKKVIYDSIYYKQIIDLIPNDISVSNCLIGYNNKFNKILKAKFTNDDLECISYEDDYISYNYFPKINFISFGHAFGWISSYLVEYLITKECYNYFYFGNCGAIGAKLKVGDIAYPNQILKLSEENNEKIYNQPFINLFQNVNEQIFHVSVDSPIVETKNMIDYLRFSKFDTIDVELFDIVSKINNSKYANLSASLIVSDIPSSIKENKAMVINKKHFENKLNIELNKIGNEINF